MIFDGTSAVDRYSRLFERNRVRLGAGTRDPRGRSSVIPLREAIKRAAPPDTATANCFSTGLQAWCWSLDV